jgi:heterodisulfide reductase subunit A
MSGRRIGVYVCHCGGNISDFVDVAQVVDAIKDEPDVVVARRAMFTCSDATQQEIVDDITSQQLDGLVVASCSPKLHTFTFRGVAARAGLNPYQYAQVNIREQCSWTHTDDREGATSKAISLVRAGIARTRLSEPLEPLEPLEVETSPRVLVIGGGITGMRAAIGLADIGLAVFLVERAKSLGGWVGGLGEMYPRGNTGRTLIRDLELEIRSRPGITVPTEADVVEKSGTYGNYRAVVRAAGERITVEIGQIIVATGFDTYPPSDGEFGYGIDGVLSLPDFKRMLDECLRQRQAPRGQPVGPLRRDCDRRSA